MTGRRWLLALPVALLLVVAATASRLHVMWWPQELHAETTARQGEPVELVDRWEDDDGVQHDRPMTVTLVAVEPARTAEIYDEIEAVRPPAGTEVWRLRLAFEADPDVPLLGCKLSIIDTEGRETSVDGGQLGEQMLPFTACVPDEAPGPGYDGRSLPDAEPRPERYEVSVYAVTDDDAEPERVRLWWDPPDYLEVAVGSGG